MNYNNPIFNYLHPMQNDMLSKLSKKELNELLNLLCSYSLEYRDDLFIDDNYSFGLEIECDHIDNPIKKDHIKELNLNYDWEVAKDSSLDQGVEVISPILNNEQKSWEDLKKVCSFLDDKSKSLDSAAAHVHVGAHSIKSTQSFINLLRIWGTYENIMFRFGFGERLSSRDLISKFARSKSYDYWNDAHLIEKFNLSYNEVVELLRGSKYTALNFNNLSRNNNIFKAGNTIEFRYANGTLNPVIWQNLVNVDTNLVRVSNSDIDMDTVYKRHEETKEYLGDLKIYDEIFLDQALEFVDLMFNTNLDKIYFLNQYLKQFRVAKNNYKVTVPLTKILTKNY